MVSYKSIAAFVALLALMSTTVFAADFSAVVKSGQLGSAAPDTAVARTIKLGANTKYINVNHGETVKVVDAKGRAFSWQFDTLSLASFPLKTIAPAEFEAGNTWVALHHPLEHTSR